MQWLNLDVPKIEMSHVTVDLKCNKKSCCLCVVLAMPEMGHECLHQKPNPQNSSQPTLAPPPCELK